MSDYDAGNAHAVSVANKLSKLPICKACNGRKTIKPMFFELECTDCCATGLDISDPLAIIRQQQVYLAKARAVIISQRNTIYGLTVDQGDQMAESMEKFYSTIKRMD